MEWKKAFHTMGITPSDYIKRFAFPVLLMGIAFPVIMLMFASLMEGYLKLIFYSIPIIFLMLIIIYPMSVYESSKRDINNNIHYYITQMGVLATSQMQLKQLLHKLSKNEAYGYLAKETEKIYMLMNDWNLSFAQACRFIARRTPSEIFADFLDRFAHAVDSGEDVETFLKREQKVVMNDFDTMYKDALHSIDLIKEIYVSMVMALLFIVSFTLILPIIMGINVENMMIGAILMFLGVEVMLIYFAKVRVPKDKIWHTLDINTEAIRKLRLSFPYSIMGILIIAILLLIWGRLPVTIEIAAVLTPLLITGTIASKEENRIKRLDDNFSSFIRSLGASAGARGGLINESLGQLIHHDFGPLTKDVKELYKRLMTRINKMRSWEFFAAGTGSNLIERFGTIFAEGTHLGGKPEVIGDIIGDNVMEINSLRKLRYSSSSNLMGTLYALTAGIAFTMYLSLAIVDMLSSIFKDIEVPPGMDIGIPITSATSMNVEFLSFMIMTMMVGHSFLSALLMRVVDGGHFSNTYNHFVGLLWTSAICAEVTLKLSQPLLHMKLVTV